MPPARISLTLFRHFSLSFIASGRSSGLHPVSSHSYCMYVRSGRPAFVRPYVGVQSSRSLMSSSLLLQQCPACLVRLTWIVFVMGGRWPYSWCISLISRVFANGLGGQGSIPGQVIPKTQKGYLMLLCIYSRYSYINRSRVQIDTLLISSIQENSFVMNNWLHLLK